MEDDQDSEQNETQKRRLPRVLRVLLWVLVVLLVISAAAATFAYSMVGKTVVAPMWLQERIQDRVAEVGGGQSLQFGRLEVVVPQSLRPQLRLVNLDIRDENGRVIAEIASADAEIEITSLLQGEVRTHAVELDGANITLRRLTDGSIDLSLANSSSARSYDDYGQMLDALDDLMQQPELEKLTTVNATGLIVNYIDERAGRTWTADGGRITIEKDANHLDARADIALLAGRNYVSTIDIAFAKNFAEGGADIAVTVTDAAAEDIATQSPALAFLGVLDAPISGAMRTTLSQDGELGALNATLEIGAGALKPTLETRAIKFENAKTYFTFHPQDQKMDFAVASVDSDWGKVTGDGTAFLTQSEGIDALVGQFRFEEIELNPYEIYDEALSFDSGVLDLQLKLNPFTVDIGQMQLNGQNQALTITGNIKADDKGWNVATDIHFDRVEHSEFMALWPADLVPKTRTWMTDNIVEAEYFDVNASLRAQANEKPNLALGFEYRDGTSRFMKSMPNVTGAHGMGSLVGNNFVVTIDKGKVTADEGGALDVAGTTVRIPNIGVKQGPIAIDLRAKSSVTAMLSILDRDPFKFLSKAEMPVSVVDGRADTRVKIGFDLKPKISNDDVTFDATSTVTSVRSDKLIKGRVLTASNLNVAVDNAGMAIRGAAKLGQIPANGVWSMAFGPKAGGKSRFEGTIELSQAFIDEFNIGLPRGSVKGRGKGQVVVDLKRNAAPTFSLVSDLNGVRLALDTLGWVKSATRRGRLEVAGQLSSPPQINRLSIDAGGLKTTGSIAISPNGSLKSASFDRVQLGGWLDAPVQLTGRGKGVAPRITIQGGSADLRRATIGSNGKGGGGPLRLRFNRLTISDSIALTNFRGEFDGTNGLDGEFSADVNGGTAIRGTVVPRRGQMGVRIRSSNAGGVLKSAGILNEGLGGNLDLSLLPAGAEGTYDGQLRVTDIGITDAPALAALFSAVSVVGLLEQMSGQGIKFTEIDSRFRLSPSRAIVQSASAVGPSIGISLDGIYDFNSKRMDFQGVFSPIYILNGIGSFLTRKGEGLIGFNYTIKGASSDPRVGVNPLSILTPGMFREIFRKPAPKIPN